MSPFFVLLRQSRGFAKLMIYCVLRYIYQRGHILFSNLRFLVFYKYHDFSAVGCAKNFALDTGRRGQYDRGKRLSEHAVGFTSIV
jgi:hypothetical protein